MGEDDKLRDESAEAGEFMDALLKKKKQDAQQSMDDLVGYERNSSPMLVQECTQAKNKSEMIWFFGGYCLCSRFYKCQYQSDGYQIVEGKEKFLCTRFGGC